MKTKLKIIKVGGKVLDDPVSFRQLIEYLSLIKTPFVLIHGGGKQADELATKLDIDFSVVNGRRVTNKEMLDVAVMIFAGLINKKTVAALQHKEINAIGLSGADGKLLLAKKRVGNIDFGFVGDLEPGGVNVDFISLLLQQNYIPVIASVTIDQQGQLLNANADNIAAVVSVALSEFYDVELFYCMDTKGIVLDQKIVQQVAKQQLEYLLSDSQIKGGMIAKLETILQIMQSEQQKVFLSDLHELGNWINDQKYKGTLITQ